jgi:hypothetical protein
VKFRYENSDSVDRALREPNWDEDPSAHVLRYDRMLRRGLGSAGSRALSISNLRYVRRYKSPGVDPGFQVRAQVLFTGHDRIAGDKMEIVPNS